MELILFISISYLLGSIPFGLILTKVFLKKDIREIGSGNIGATNVLRTGNKAIGYLTLILDVLKAMIPILYIKFNFPELVYMSSLSVFIGHVFPIWLKFKGGKGVASFLGLLAFISWPLTLLFCMTWLISVKLFKISAAGAILAIVINVIIFKSVLIVQFSYNMILWVPGTTLEFNIILMLSMLVLCKHYSNFKDFFKK